MLLYITHCRVGTQACPPRFPGKSVFTCSCSGGVLSSLGCFLPGSAKRSRVCDFHQLLLCSADHLVQFHCFRQRLASSPVSSRSVCPTACGAVLGPHASVRTRAIHVILILSKRSNFYSRLCLITNTTIC